MKRTIIAILCVLALGATVTNARASLVNLTVGDGYYVGSIVPGHPAGNEDELLYIKALTALGIGETGTITINSTVNTLSRVDSSLATLPEVGSYDSKIDNGSTPTLSFAYDVYVLGKYDAEKGGSFVWLVTAGTEFTLPDAINGKDLSHTTVFKAVPIPPSALLLGSSLLGMVGFGLRRQRQI